MGGLLDAAIVHLFNPPSRQPIPRQLLDVHPEQLARLLTGDSDHDLPTRTAKICEIIDLVPIEDVHGVLDYSERLILNDNIDTANLGYTVAAKIARYNECTPFHRVNFFTKIVRRSATTESHRLRYSYLLSCLTDEGRNVEGFESLLPELTLRLHSESTIVNEKSDPFTNTVDLELTPTESLHVLSNVIKFNARFISDDDVRALLQHMLRESKDAPSSLYPKLLAILDNLIAYTAIPRDVVHTLSAIISSWVGSAYIRSRRSDHGEEYKRKHEVCIEKCWMTFTRLLSTHLRDLAMDGLLDCLHDDNKFKQQAQGAAMLIHRALTDVQTRRTVNLDLGRLLEVLELEPGSDAIANSCVRLKLIRDLLADQDMQHAFVAELDWTHLHKAITASARAPDLLASDSDSQPQPEVICQDADMFQERRDLTSAIIEQLETLPGISLTQSRALRKIALSSALLLNERQTARLIEAYHPSAFRISVGNWLPEIKELAQVFIRNGSMELKWRQQALNVVSGALEKAQELSEPEAVLTCGTIIIEALETEKNHIFRGNLVHSIISFVSQHLISNDEGFQRVVDALVLSARLEKHDDISGIESKSTSVEELPSMLPEAGLVVLFMRSSMTHPQRARLIYRKILDLLACHDPNNNPEATVMLMRGLFRIRSDIEHHIFFVASPEGERLATTLDRNSNEPRMSLRRSSLPWERDPAPLPVWRYGDIEGLPEPPPTTISPILRSDPSHEEGREDDCHLDMAEWLRTVIAIIEHGADWEVYSYVIVHLAAQLSNQSLFTEAIPEIRSLAKVICQKIQQQTVFKPPEVSNLRQGDVAFCHITILTTIIGYHWNFPRNETENMVSTFIMGLTAWDITTVPCVHALTLCCYELPISLSRDLVRIVEKMSTIVTKSDAAIHVLEFLAGLSRLEQLTTRFHGDEIKTVFGVCFSYIEYVRGKRYDEAQQRASGRSNNPTRQGSVASGHRPSTEDLPQYVFAISYHVITFWFLTLKVEDRRKYFPWMEQRLVSRDQEGKVEDEALVTLDHLWRITQGRSMESASPVPQSASPAEPDSKTWISEYCILTIACQEGAAAEAVERRCSGTDFRQLPAPSESATPDDVFAHHSLSSAMNQPFKSAAPPVPLPMIDATKRALTIFDRTSPVDFFKCGVIYVGEAQTEEAEILANVSGSPDYNMLVSGLGARVKLTGHRGNVAGLDTSEGAFDGLATHQYSDGVTTLNYHVTTLMPTNRDVDPLCTRKKSHIGNDYVNIVFNNSGLVQGFDFHTFPSAFNYVYIVVTPEARQTFIQTRTRSRKARWFEESWFRVQLLTREDFPDISSAAETKVVSGAALAAYVRNLALNAEVFCRVWTNRGSGEYPSSWRARLGQIRQLRQRVDKMEKVEKASE